LTFSTGAVEVKCHEQRAEAQQMVLKETQAKLAELGFILDDLLSESRGRTASKRRRSDTGRALAVKY
jgi:hypothetical protein